MAKEKLPAEQAAADRQAPETEKISITTPLNRKMELIADRNRCAKQKLLGQLLDLGLSRKCIEKFLHLSKRPKPLSDNEGAGR